ncbi:hypothetical protein BSKO_00020 [Bryopsis sp. KO-2023]|nr:hypothetical protein BSKO_00020 [Bryopsis sp. KO-2023]
MDSSERAEPVKFFPQWMLIGPSTASNQQRERENSWSRSRRGDSNPAPDPISKNSNSRYELSGRALTVSDNNVQRRSSDRYRQTRYERYTPRTASRSELLFDETSAGGSYAPRNGPLTRSFSEGNGRQLSRTHRRDERETIAEREVGKQRQRHHRSASSRDVAEREGRVGGEAGRFGGLPHGGISESGGGSARHTREHQKEQGPSVKANFEKNFPSLGERHYDRGSGSWSGHSSSGSQGRWTSRLAEQPLIEENGDIPPRRSPPPPPPPPSLSPPPAQPARMADAVQQNPVDPEQNIIAEKHRLEMEQSRRLIPVIATPGAKTKGGVKGQSGGGRRGEHRDTLQRFSNMISATNKRMEDVQKHDSTLVLPKKSGSVSQRNMVLETSISGMNGHTTQHSTSPGPDRQDIPPRGRRSRGESHDFSTHEKAKAQEREQNRIAFYNNLRRQSGQLAPSGENVEPISVVKRTVSEPSVFDPTNLGKDHEGDGKGGSGVDSIGDDGMVISKAKDSIESRMKELHVGADGGLCSEKSSENYDDSHLWMPSAEEERFLVSLGWSANDEVTLLTEEEIAAWRKEKAHTSTAATLSLKSRAGARGFAPCACSAFHLNTIWHHTSSGFLVGSERTTSDSDSM